MVDDELAEIRRRRMEQLQRQAMDQQTVEEEALRQQQIESQIRLALMEILEPEARERLNTIKLTRPEFAKAVEQQLVMLAQGGRIRQRITDDQLKSLLVQLTPSKKEFRITRK
ncbi:DNA-binding protein [Methanoculleus bourgensis]|jgi:programmed cell death protein 5|uniref:DNA-binding protein HQQ74_01680 n=1 Tax=Methanoculleus bourgensis TaxID=83986 RepID=A0A0X3BIG7_9EURY|nr:MULTISPECIES: DNA-binding protein [Methanoculleus]MBT0731926.1 DNA-binding protein [Methanoculleus bourgensis]MDD3372528.1 DNA-binding protein [Methanoculleus bourgensis]NMA88865.1 DNA-binding protein [Methanoculleus bourgensis]NQS77424.1 DNA-binding protein [Methanoculleus bourgensis]CVK31590.1 DNA-binding protein Memar_1972 [Methanoculleus bourgensis]